MCGRFAQVFKRDTLAKLERELKLGHIIPELAENYNVAPNHTVGAFVEQAQERYLGFFRWGLIPSWMKEPPQSSIINARSDSLTQKPSFRGALVRRRCVIPALGFYEFAKGSKQPYFIHYADDSPMLMAGIYDAWSGADGSFIPSLAIITMDANEQMSDLHHRMPVLLDQEAANIWLDSKIEDTARMQLLIHNSGQMPLTIYKVNYYVNKVQNTGPKCVVPLEQ
ncbi:MAG TPA: SOS response-associated peptidase [Candidatus Cloacimonadota bacterium]|nr:SOS response-associated peptidase [Candidatus Cloacimonadota bacterium]